MIVFMRSLATIVSNVKLSGAICTRSVSCGTLVAPALPESEKSVSSTVIFSDRLVVEQRLQKRHRVHEGAPGVRHEERLARRDVDQPHVAGFDLLELREGGR